MTTLRLKRQCALLLAMFYVTFAGGIEFLHSHTDGIFPDFGVIRSSASQTAAQSGIGKAPIAKQQAPSSECAACHWAQNGLAAPPSVQPPVFAPIAEPSYVLFSSSFPRVHLDTPSSRGPPLS
jgi:hypothetical protein